MSQHQNNQNRKITLKDLGDLRDEEINLIHSIRNRFRFGELVIITRDGIPQQIRRYVEIQPLLDKEYSGTLE